MNKLKIKKLLIEKGQHLLKDKKVCVNFTTDSEANKLLNDLEKHPHAFVIACIMDRQTHSERAWLIPYRISQRLGNFCFSTLKELSLEQINDLMTKPETLPRFPKNMSNNFHEAINVIKEQYNEDASLIWKDTPSSAEVVYRFLQFKGVGPKIATMATNILARNFKIPFSDYYSIDISVDVHVRRVFTRLGLSSENAKVEELVYRARALNPEFPGLMDLPAWEIGRDWCRAKKPLCTDCYMKEICTFAISQGGNTHGIVLA